jgi:cysteinyl-tRNA synthetase
MIKKINTLIAEQAIAVSDASRIIEAFQKIDSVLNVFDFTEQMPEKKIQRLIEERDEARRNKNWRLADQIREELVAKGVEVRDRKTQSWLNRPRK